jgi:hypothetical protein
MSEAFVNQVTLNCLMNKEQYSKYVTNVVTKTINKRDKKFYRKRIYNLTKELLLTDETQTCLLPDVKYAFDNYIKTCIYYFKALDNNDIIQEEYKEINNAELNKLFDKDTDLDNIITPEEANKFLMRSIKLNNPSLDNFVIKTITKIPEDIILPKQKEINLMDPILKNKGICKKKNITNKYDETTKNENNKNNENPKI